ncbi:MAG TPA: glycosyltransferase [Synechococcales cyanobacterium M55_K2018_004]|nr:glycosyltransferase [Synechococcales cyanobacterium M55_K2018_004]
MADGSDLQQVTQMLVEEAGQLARRESDRSQPQRLLLLELFNRRESFAYLWYLVHYWSEWRLAGHLDVVLTPQFLQNHPEILDLVKRQATPNIQITAIAPEMAALLIASDRPPKRNNRPQQMLQPFRAWSVLCHYARQLQSTQCLVMDLDGVALPLALAAQAPCPISGLCFHPLRDRLGDHRPRDQKFSCSVIRSWQQRTLLHRILKRDHLKQLFCVDPLVVKLPLHLDPYGKAVPLPDPVHLQWEVPPAENWCEQWAIEPGRRVFLYCTNDADHRSDHSSDIAGVSAMLEAIAHLPPSLCRQMCLVIVGQLEPEAQSRLAYQVAALRRQRPVQVLSQVQAEGRQPLPIPLHLADVVVVPSRKTGYHGGLLTQAARLQTPILTTDEGLIGELVKRGQLGLTVRAGSTQHLAVALAYLLETPLEQVGDRQQMQQFAAWNTDVRFAATVFRYLCPL